MNHGFTPFRTRFPLHPTEAEARAAYIEEHQLAALAREDGDRHPDGTLRYRNIYTGRKVTIR